MENTIVVLLVEDEETHAELIFRSMEDVDLVEMNWVKSLKEARAFIEKKIPDLVVSDWRLPDGAGIEIAIEGKGELIYPLILMTSFGNEQLAVEAMKAGVMDYIVKSPDSFKNMPLIIRQVLREWTHVLARRQAEKALIENEEKYRNLVENIPDWVWETGIDGMYTYSSGRVYEILGYLPQEVIGHLPSEFVYEQDKTFFTVMAKNVMLKQKQLKIFEFDCKHKEGHKVFIESRISPLFTSEGIIKGFIGTNRDITERKQAEERLHEISIHDSLTGLYNRNYFENKMLKLKETKMFSAGMVICDLDGLKLINDTLGHAAGDNYLFATAQILYSAFPPESVISRIGGDEFAILMMNTTEEQIEQSCKRLKQELENYNSMKQSIPLSISFGYIFSNGDGINFYEMLKEADNRMYREKLHRRQSMKSEIVQTMKTMLEARDFITEGHASRMEELACRLAIAVGISENDLADIRLLAEFHDIGKVGIPDHILFKPAKLNEEEFEVMKHHPEIGHRIAEASIDMMPIADGILKHHEHWNGEGYPFGLYGDDIPIECRILSIVDAFDAMTNDRPYRKAMKVEDAFAELQRCAGTQFDPELVEKFIAIMRT